MDREDIDTWTELATNKGRRARRRELEAVRESGHLRRWLADRNLYLNDVSGRETGLFRQFMRAYRHSCHAACCAVEKYEKHRTARRARYAARQELRKRR